MSELYLFPAKPLLEKRFGKDLFDEIPELPVVLSHDFVQDVHLLLNVLNVVIYKIRDDIQKFFFGFHKNEMASIFQ